ncbi:MAG: hypothetical protein A3E31_14985 [Candidatus Rokubacteria bacterium RIFCSPHIGHO2_12_FULL_73_22]|nr:MAG: hypothetical protein A3E31_14985 [Candidatus Rokubacteria bacterium RIFCSPHIGHO2_12_FULL_73_22]
MSARTRSTTFSRLASSVCVAPKSRANRSLLSSRSAAMIWRAPARRAPCTTFRPTPPQPTTSTAAPASTPAQRVTAPTPVGTQQPISAACGHGISSRIGTSISAGQTTASENVPMRAIWKMSWPLRVSRVVPSSMAQRTDGWPSQRIERPIEQ